MSSKANGNAANWPDWPDTVHMSAEDLSRFFAPTETQVKEAWPRVPRDHPPGAGLTLLVAVALIAGCVGAALTLAFLRSIT